MKDTESMETLFCALIYLMSRHAMSPGRQLPPVIADHLQWVAEHKDADRHPTLRDACRRLAPLWTELQTESTHSLSHHHRPFGSSGPH